MNMPKSGKTIQIYLPHGDPRGMRIAEITTGVVQAVAIPRSRLDQVFARDESKNLAVYFLFGDSDDEAKPLVYIGQTEDLKQRLQAHASQKEFWRTVVFLISRTQTFTHAHIRYLEWISIQVASESLRFSVRNTNVPSKPFVPEHIEADLSEIFETARTLLATLGFPLFEPIAPTHPTYSKIEKTYMCMGPNADARGTLTDDGFVVFKGGLARLNPAPSGIDVVVGLQQKLRSSGILEAEGEGQLRFTQDYLFASPSTAAAIVLARSANGWREWKNAQGQTLHELHRYSSADE